MQKGMDVGSFQVYSGGTGKTYESPSPIEPVCAMGFELDFLSIKEVR